MLITPTWCLLDYAFHNGTGSLRRPFSNPREQRTHSPRLNSSTTKLKLLVGKMSRLYTPGSFVSLSPHINVFQSNIWRRTALFRVIICHVRVIVRRSSTHSHAHTWMLKHAHNTVRPCAWEMLLIGVGFDYFPSGGRLFWLRPRRPDRAGVRTKSLIIIQS